MNDESLPSALREALRSELDEDETVRWAGQPVAARVFRRALTFLALSGVTVGCLAALLVFAAWIGRDVAAETRGTPAAEGTRNAFVGFAVVGGVVLLTGGLVIREPWRVKKRAMRTVYAVTGTRVLVLVLKPSGRVDVESLEPSHPLLIVRHEHAGGCGDIMIGRRAGPKPGGADPSSGGLLLEATPDSRAVERIIRRTFDPPPPARPGTVETG